MVARYAGASLGLPATTIIIVTAGLMARNPVTVTLSQNIHVFFLKCFIGLVLGRSAHVPAAEHEHKRETEIRKRHRGIQESTVGDGLENRSTDQTGRSILLQGLPI